MGAKWYLNVRVPKQSYLIQSALHVAAPLWYKTTLKKVITDKAKLAPTVISTLVSSDPQTVASLSKEPGLYRLIGFTAKWSRSTELRSPDRRVPLQGAGIVSIDRLHGQVVALHSAPIPAGKAMEEAPRMPGASL